MGPWLAFWRTSNGTADHYAEASKCLFNFQLAGFQVQRILNRPGTFLDSHLYIVLPLWLFLLFAIPPVLWVRRYRRNRGRGFAVMVTELSEATT